jgi:glutathione S-transferase
MLLQLMRAEFEVIEVPYGNREQLARLTGGYIYVPVLVEDDGNVVTESRIICQRLCAREGGARFVPSPFEGPVWAYHDFVDGPLEDVLFRIASPDVRDAWESPFDRALYTLVKERKFGAGCIDAWRRDRDELLRKARVLLEPTVRTLRARTFLFGDAPTLADCALYGAFAMLDEADRGLLPRIDDSLPTFVRLLERRAAER